MTLAPSRPDLFSKGNPKLQIAWDATSMNALLKCPCYYDLTINQGWRKSSVHLDFGGFLADGLETFQKARMSGLDLKDAILHGLRRVMELSWNEDGTQWGGYWEDQWKCGGLVKYKNAKGNAAKCPYSHKRMWFPPPAPDVCGECGGDWIVHSKNYCPDHPTKHRVNLARALVWYGLDQPDNPKDGLHPFVFPDGTPAVELSWRLPLARKSPHGDTYLLCGHFDYIGVYGDEIGVVDNKTTKNTLGGSYFSTFSPHVQVDTYDMVAPLLFPELDFSWFCIDALQIMKDTIRTGRHFYRKAHSQRVEHFDMIQEVIDRAEKYAAADKWPMDKSSCAMCEFKGVCSAPLADRPGLLTANYTTNFWNPMRSR